MKVVIDVLILNIAALAAFILRQNYGDFIIKEHPSVYWPHYLVVLVLINLAYPFIFWLLGLYDKRQKRALLEEWLLIFGVFSTSLALLIIFLFLGRLWWMSRIVLFTFWGLSIVLMAVSRLIWRNSKKLVQLMKYDTTNLQAGLLQKKMALQNMVFDGLSIIIVTHNSSDKIETCLRSLKQANLKMPHEIIVVDNCSTDGAIDKLKSNYLTVKYIINQTNLGYSKALNIGIKVANYDQVLILNPDIIVLPGAIEIMADYLAKNIKVGLVGCKLLNVDGTLQYSVRRFLDFRTYLYRFTPLRGLMVGSAIERYYLMQEWDHNNNRLVDWVLGGCMLVRLKALKEVGMMDEDFFVYFEDVDLCSKMWEKGWQVAYVAEVAMIHKHMRTSANKLFNRATWEHLKSLWRFLRKHGFHLPKNAPSSLE